MKKIVFFILVALAGIQFIPVIKTNPKVDESLTLKAPKEVMSILKNSCYDCHSNETKWPYYANIAPVSFFVVKHVDEGRAALNFSEWNTIEKQVKIERLKRGIVTVKNGMMALPSYTSVHGDAELTKEEKLTLVKWFESELVTVSEGKVNHLFQVR